MKIELKTINISKSKIQQMVNFGVPLNPDVEVLGWVNMGKYRYVIVKSIWSIYRAEYIVNIDKEIKGVQFTTQGGGYEFLKLTSIKCTTFNRGSFNYSPERDDKKNLELYDHLVSFKRKTEIAGQIYY